MILQVARWGNSLALRIPGAFARQTHIIESSSVDLNVVDGKLVITPISDEPSFELESLLSAILPENIPNESDFIEARPRGREVW